MVNGVTYCASVTNIQYRAHQSQVQTNPTGSLIDRGANGGLSGADVRVLSTSSTQFADINGIANASLTNVPLCTVAGYIDTDKGPIIGIFHQYAHTGEGHTIHSPLQMEAFGLEADEKSSAIGSGTQTITHPDGYKIPLSYVCWVKHSLRSVPDW